MRRVVRMARDEAVGGRHDGKRPDWAGRTSDPTRSNREPARDRGAEQAREAPVDRVPGGPRKVRDDGESGNC
jgi:hypothetical protein